MNCGHHHHHHHVVPLARISQNLSRYFSLAFITSGRSSGLHPVSSHSCCMYVLSGRPAFARPYVGVHRSASLMSSSLLLQQYPACLVRLTWIVFVMGGRWPYSWCLVGCCWVPFNPYLGADKTVPKSTPPKMNTNVWLEFEPAYCDVKVEYGSHYSTRVPARFSLESYSGHWCWERRIYRFEMSLVPAFIRKRLADSLPNILSSFWFLHISTASVTERSKKNKQRKVLYL